jgi:glycosyltransferase involved in cell wall biosynthesis/CelD/BcsL family acetyltransferase involved in cellulose biosynthesis
MPLSVVNVGYPLAPVGPDAIGGAEQIVHALDRALTRAEQRSSVVAQAGSVVSGSLLPLPAPAEPFDDEGRHAVWRAVGAALAALGDTPDVVHLHGVDFPAYLPETRRPLVVTVHLPLACYPASFLAAHEGRVRFVAVSYAQAATARGFGFSDEIPNGVDLEFLLPQGEAESYAVTLGRICPEKGFHFAVAAAKEAGLELRIGGHVFPYPEHRAYFETELAPALDAQRRFIGAVSRNDKPRLLGRARCVIVPSLVEETCSLVALEALACGTPVVGLRRGALAEVVEHGKTGLLVERPEELGAALRDIGAIDRESCRRAAVERFAAARMTSAYLELYARLAAASSGAQSSTMPALSTRGAAAATRWRRVESLGELTSLARSWRALWQRCPDATVFSRPEWLLPWAGAFGPEHVLALVAERGGELAALVPLCITEGSLGPWQLLGVGNSDYGEVLAASAELLEEAVERARREVGARGVAFDAVASDTRLALELRRRGGAVTSEEVCPALALVANDAFAGVPAHLRKKLGRDRRRAARAGLSVERVEQRSLAEVVRCMFAYGKLRFAGAASLFADARAQTFLLEAGARLHAAGALRLHALWRGRECVGALYAFRSNDRLLSYQHAYHPALADLSPGIVLTAHAIESAALEGCASFDFLRGGEAYKYAWGARDRQLVKLVLAGDRALEPALAS